MGAPAPQSLGDAPLCTEEAERCAGHVVRSLCLYVLEPFAAFLHYVVLRELASGLEALQTGHRCRSGGLALPSQLQGPEAKRGRQGCPAP